MTKFTLTMHPASEGDALQLTWNSEAGEHHAFIDLGRTRDYKTLHPILKAVARPELVVFTHIDADHIEGAAAMFKADALPFRPERVLFNTRVQHVAATERCAPGDRVPLSAGQAEKVTSGMVHALWPLNGGFGSGIVSVDSDEAREPMELAGGLRITLLSPTDRKLAALLPEWDEALEKAGLRTTDPDEVDRVLHEGRVALSGIDVDQLASKRFIGDTTEPNGASIAFIAEWGGKKILLGADAHSDVLEASLRALGARDDARFRLDCFKISHHGSKANTSPTLLGLIDCTRFAFSTDGSRHQHPDPETIARILKVDPSRTKTLYFNFRQPQTVIWDNEELMAQWNYRCVFPREEGGSLAIVI